MNLPVRRKTDAEATQRRRINETWRHYFVENFCPVQRAAGRANGNVMRRWSAPSSQHRRAGMSEVQNRPSPILCIGWDTIRRIANGEPVWSDEHQCGVVAADDLFGADIDALFRCWRERFGKQQESVHVLAKPKSDWPLRHWLCYLSREMRDPSGGTTGRVKPYGRLGWMGARAEYSCGEGFPLPHALCRRQPIQRSREHDFFNRALAAQAYCLAG
jgi:hypothetical protein